MNTTLSIYTKSAQKPQYPPPPWTPEDLPLLLEAEYGAASREGDGAGADRGLGGRG